jgi:hypothetical protein
MSIARTIVGRLVVGREQAIQSHPGGDAFCREIVKPQEWCLAHHERKVPGHVVFIASQSTCGYTVHLEPYTQVGATVVLLN